MAENATPLDETTPKGDSHTPMQPILRANPIAHSHSPPQPHPVVSVSEIDSISVAVAAADAILHERASSHGYDESTTKVKWTTAEVSQLTTSFMNE